MGSGGPSGGGGGGGATGPTGATGATGPTGSTGSSGGGSSATVTLTSAQIKGLDLTPVTIIAAPGVGKAIQLIAPPFVQYKFGTVKYPVTAINPGIVISLNYTAAANVGLNLAEVNDFVTRAPGTPPSISTQLLVFSGPSSANSTFAGLFAAIPIANTPIVLGVAADNNFLSYNCGPITTLTVANGGLLYAVNDTFTIDAGVTKGDTGDATGHVTSVSVGGVVTGVAINAPGVSYMVTTANSNSGPYPTAHTSGIGNDALTLNVTGATTGDGTAVVTALYQTITLQ